MELFTFEIPSFRSLVCRQGKLFMSFFFASILFRGQAILIRQKEDDAVAGLFSQIGELYVVHHIWGEYMVAQLSKKLMITAFCTSPKAFKSAIIIVFYS